MNAVFAIIILVACGVAALTGSMEAVSAAVFKSAKGAAELSLGLVGYMAFFLGLMKIGEEGGLLKMLGRAIRPVMTRLFPDVPPDHPAMGAMILNISANMLGLGNAATPLGIKAMHELNKLNTTPGVATNAMVLFLAINTSGLALLPSGVVAIRDLEGSQDPWGIMAPTLLATGLSTLVGITVAKLTQRFFPVTPIEAEGGDAGAAEATPPKEAPSVDLSEGESSAGVWLLAAFLVAGIGALVTPAIALALLPAGDPQVEQMQALATTMGNWVVPVMIVSLVLFGWARGLKVYEVFVVGAKEGFEIAVRIIPYLVAILVAVGMFRASGAMDMLTRPLGGLTDLIGLPAEVLPMALVRPLSGSGAFGIMTELVKTHGPDSYIGYVATTLNGSTETTFYVLAVYFGAVGVSRVRHAVVAGLAADVTGAVASALICLAMFG
jgi:spore maturation protein SpmA/spore maturation protein SpmB